MAEKLAVVEHLSAAASRQAAQAQAAVVTVRSTARFGHAFRVTIGLNNRRKSFGEDSFSLILAMRITFGYIWDNDLYLFFVCVWGVQGVR